MPDFKDEVKKLQEKKQAVMNTAETSQVKASSNAPLQPDMKALNKASDALRDRYVKILKHDFTGQDWIVKNKDRRANINKNYRAVTGKKTDLSNATASKRRKEMESRRKLSLAASTVLTEHITVRDQRKMEWAGRDKGALAKELMSKEAEEFALGSDEAFIASFGKKMAILDDAASLRNEVSKGNVPQGVDAKELSEKLLLLEEIRTAYENRIKIITSPYYLSIRDEDLSGKTMEHLGLISKNEAEADESLKSYADAVIGWKTAKASLFSKDRLKENEAQNNGEGDELPLPDYHIHVANMEGVIADSELQTGLNCYGCSGSLAFNLFLKNTGEYTDRKKTNQYQIRSYVPKNMKTFEELRDVFEKEMGFDMNSAQQSLEARKLYNDYVDETMKFCGKGKVAEGNVYEIADFFMERSKDVSLHKMTFHMPGRDGKLVNKNKVPYKSPAEKETADKLYHNMKVMFINKVKDVLESGNVVSLLMMNNKRHYITIVGIEGQDFIYADSLYGNVERRKPIEELFDRMAMGDTAEITWFSKTEAPEKLKADYPDAGLEYDPENGFTAKKRNATDHLYMGHRKGISVSREVMQNVSESVYLPTNKAAWKDEPIEEYERDEEEAAQNQKAQKIKPVSFDQDDAEKEEEKEEKPAVEKKARKTKRIRISGEKISDSLENGTLQGKEGDISSAKLTAENGRNLSRQLLSDHKFGGDSKEMQKVKNSIEQLETVLSRQGRKALKQKDIDYIADLYQTAMDSCRAYCVKRDPSQTTGIRRWGLVRDALSRLTREAELVEIANMAIKEGGRGEIEITNGVDLLAFGGLTDQTRKLRKRDPLKELLGKQEDFDVQKAEYDELYKRKEKEYQETYGIFASARMYLDSDLNEAKESLDENRVELERLNESYRNAKERREQDQKTVGENMEALPKELRPIAEMFSLGKAPTALIKNLKKQSDKDRMFLNEALRAMASLDRLSAVSPNVVTVYLFGKCVRFVTDAYGNLTMRTKEASVSLKPRADEISAVISRDVIENREAYGDDAVRVVLDNQKTDLPGMTRGELLRAREYCARVLHKETGVAMNLMNNVSLTDLKRFALLAMRRNVNRRNLKAEFSEFVDTKNKAQSEQNVNSVLNLELMSTGVELTDGVKLLSEEKEESGWSKEEEMVRDLAADLLFSKDSWIADSTIKTPGERIRGILLEHSAAVALIISDEFRDREKNPEGIVDAMVEKLPLFTLGTKDAGGFKEKIKTALSKLKGFVEEHVDEMGLGEAGGKLVKLKLKNRYLTEDIIIKKLKTLEKEKMEQLSELDSQLDDMVKDAMEDVQDALDECVDDIFKPEEEEQQEKKESPRKEQPKKGQKKKGKDPAADALAEKKALEKEAKDRRMDAIRQRIEKRKNGRRELEEEIEKDEAAIAAKRKELPKLEAEWRKESLEQQHKYSDLHDEKEKLMARLSEVDNEATAKLKEYESRLNNLEKNLGPQPPFPNDLPEHKELVKKIMELQIEIDKAFDGTAAAEKKSSDFEKSILEMKRAVEEKKKALKDYPKKSGKELEDILNETATGKKGQGLFMKNVFKTYFKSMPRLDQRSMIAGAIKNSKPALSVNKGEKVDLSTEEGMELASGMLGGMFKGAGPLFQKMLQGIPLSGKMPKGLKKAIEDTQDNLASIPDEVVRAHMESIIGRSNGKVERIEVQKSLGAASVGQAFLCTVYGPDMEKGKQVVIKLLRPDARNRMMREKEVMLKAARTTDEQDMLPVEIKERRRKKQIGGMEATYLGNLQRIEEELDLTKEADNCRKGAVYDKTLIDSETKKEKENISDSMKLSDLADPTSDTCVMELAGTKNVKTYMREVKEKRDRLLRPFCEETDEVDKEGKKTGRKILKLDEEGNFVIRTDLTQKEKIKLLEVNDELIEMANDLDLRQRALAQVAEKWVSEGIFNAGYYHGDLHAGNIMISEKGVTVIDFGNATTLNKEQQEHITKMMMAATFGDVATFRHSFHALLENTPEEVYQEKRDELTLAFTEVLNMGTEEDAALRIAVALAKAQEIGLELPPAIANFTSCQMRLQNTIKDANNTLKSIQGSIAMLSKNATFNMDITKADAVSSVVVKTARARTEKTIKKICKRTLSQMETVSEEDFLNLIDENPENLDKEFGIRAPIKLSQEMKRMEEIVKGGHPTAKEKEIAHNQGVRNIFPETDYYINHLTDQEQQNFLTHMLNSVENEIEFRMSEEDIEKAKKKGKPVSEDRIIYDSLEDFAHRVGLGPNSANRKKWKSLSVMPRRTALDDSIDGYLKEKAKEKENEALKRDDVHKEKLLLYGKQVYAGYRLKQAEKIKITKRQFELNIDALLPMFRSRESDEEGIKKEREEAEKNIALIDQIVEVSASNKTNGKELVSEYKKFKGIFEQCLKVSKEQAKHYSEMLKQFDKVKEVLWQAQIHSLHELMDNARDGGYDRSNHDPDSFLNVMGEVLNRYKTTLGWRLGIIQGFKVKKGIKKLEKENSVN